MVSGVAVAVASGVGAGVVSGIAVGEACGVAVGVACGVAVGVASGVAVRVILGVVVGVLVGEASGVAARLGVGVAVDSVPLGEQLANRQAVTNRAPLRRRETAMNRAGGLCMLLQGLPFKKRRTQEFKYLGKVRRC